MLNYAVAEHVENAGVHSGDATLILPAQKLFVETHRRVKKISEKICAALQISGPFNIQFMCKDNEVKVIECNLRASRSLPFISKTFGVNFIELATRVMLDLPVRTMDIRPIDLDYVTCKVPTFSFARLKNSDPRLGVEMQSTGEVACFGQNQYEAFLKSWIASGHKLPAKNILLSIGGGFQGKRNFLGASAAPGDGISALRHQEHLREPQVVGPGAAGWDAVRLQASGQAGAQRRDHDPGWQDRPRDQRPGLDGFAGGNRRL